MPIVIFVIREHNGFFIFRVLHSNAMTYFMKCNPRKIFAFVRVNCEVLVIVEVYVSS